MKRILLLIALFFGLIAVSQASTYAVTNTISYNLTYDSTSSIVGFFTINGFTSAGTCNKDGGGAVILVLKGDVNGNRMYAKLLIAQANGTSVTTGVDDTKKDGSGNCYTQYVY